MTSVNGNPATLLASRLRELREEWADVNLTQVKLATALGKERRVAPATLSSWENANNPKPPPAARLKAYARFFATRRSLEGEPHLLALTELDEKERERFDELEQELLELHAALANDDDPSPPVEDTRRLLLSFDDPEPLPGPIVILCPEAPAGSRGPLADKNDINYTRLHRFADADALLETFGHIRSLNPKRQVLHRLPGDVRSSDLQGHLVILGGIGWNPTLRRIQSELIKRLPIEQFEDPSLPTGEVFRVRKGEGDERTYFPKTDETDGELTDDIGLIARIPNPYNSRRTLTICNGVHSTGVLGAVLALTDESVRVGNETYLANHYPRGEFAMLVWVPVLSGTVLAPDLMNPEARIFEWSPTAGD